MYAPGSAERNALRRVRTTCRVCGQTIELQRLRAHLREAHQLDSARVETGFLDARREARRTSRVVRR